MNRDTSLRTDILFALKREAFSLIFRKNESATQGGVPPNSSISGGTTSKRSPLIP